MPRAVLATGPTGEKRRADVIANAVYVMRVATGEAEERTWMRPYAEVDASAESAQQDHYCGASSRGCQVKALEIGGLGGARTTTKRE